MGLFGNIFGQAEENAKQRASFEELYRQRAQWLDEMSLQAQTNAYAQYAQRTSSSMDWATSTNTNVPVFTSATTTVTSTSAFTNLGLLDDPPVMVPRKLDREVDPDDPLKGFHEVIDAYADGAITRQEMSECFSAWLKGQDFSGFSDDRICEIAAMATPPSGRIIEIGPGPEDYDELPF